MNEIAAVIVTYNRRDLLMEGLQALLTQTVPCDIVIIDNHSSDGTEEAVHALLPDDRIRYNRMSENLGGAGGFSYGTKLAYEMGYTYIWLMDDDCIVQKGTLSALLKADQQLQGQYGYLCSKVLWTDGRLCKTNIQRYPMRKLVTDFTSPLVRVNYATFVSMFFHRDRVKELGLPIADFFIWSDDLEYTGRFSFRYPCYLCNESVVNHKTRSNDGINIAIEPEDRIHRFRYIYRNDVYVFRRHGLRGWCFLFVRMLYHIYKILRYSKGNKWKKIRMVVKGNIDGLRYDPPIEYAGA